MLEEIKAKAKELLKTKQVDVVIGYKRASDGILAMPAFITKEEDAEQLIWDGYCVYNLSNYLLEYKGRRAGIVAKTCDVKSIVVLLQENQLKREEVFIIGVECSGIVHERVAGLERGAEAEIGFEEKCRGCKPSIPPFYDALIKQEGQKSPEADLEKDQYESVRKMEAKSAQDRFQFWEEEFSRCIRCYACRQICPMCYCPKCVADQTMPAWFSRAANFKGNFSWNVTRAMHLAGRCIDCGECERACPAGIPLREINKKIEKDAPDLFVGFNKGYRASW
jgi:ferredoxin